MESLLSVSPWRELFWIAVGGLFFSLLCVSGALLRAALWPPPRASRRTAETRTVAAAAAAAEADDLAAIEGIGPAIAALLRAHDIRTYRMLAACRPAQLRRILRDDSDLARAEPSTWPFQARLLAEERYGDFVRLIARLRNGVPRLVNVDGIDQCHAARLREGGICTIAELQRSSVSRVTSCFPQNDRAHISRLAQGWIDQAGRLHDGDEATLCALAGIANVSGPVRAGTGRAATRAAAVRTASAAESDAADAGLMAYWQRESLLRLLCAPLLALALLLFLLLFALLGLIPSPAPGPGPIIVHGGGGTTISMIQGTMPGSGPNYPPYPPYPPNPPNPPYPPYPPYPPGYQPYYPPGYMPYYPPPYPWPYPPPNPQPRPSGSCCQSCPQPTCQTGSCGTDACPDPAPDSCACGPEGG